MKKYLHLVKFSHTIFAMPFAMIGLFLAHFINDLSFDIIKLILVVMAMIFARNAAMGFNRYIDRDIDLNNDRTKVREIPSGAVTPKSALLFVIINCSLFISITFFINPLCLYLSPVALFLVLFYSYTKRFTALCHFVLGLGLSLAPIGAYIAVTGSFHIIPILYGLAVLFWVAGFDIIYALQDINFDKENKLKSTPALVGINKALLLSVFSHLLCALFLITAGILLSDIHQGIGILHWVAVGIFCVLLIYQHSIVGPDKLAKINMAFFTTNGIASILFASLVILDFYY